MFLFAKLVLDHLYGQSCIAELKRELQPEMFPDSLEQVWVNNSLHTYYDQFSDLVAHDVNMS